MALTPSEQLMIENMQQQIRTLQGRVETLESAVAQTETVKNAQNREEDIRELLEATEETVVVLQDKLNTVLLPDETLMYLNKYQFTNLRSRLQEFEQLASDLRSLRVELIQQLERMKELII